MGILTSWVFGLRIYSSGLLRVSGLSSGWESSTSVRWRSRFPDGIHVEFYASGGASFSCCYKGQYIISTLKVGIASITFFGILATFGCVVSVIGTSGGRSQDHRLFEWSSSRPVEQHLWLEHQSFIRIRGTSTSITKFCPTSTRYEYGNICQQNIS